MPGMSFVIFFTSRKNTLCNFSFGFNKDSILTEVLVRKSVLPEVKYPGVLPLVEGLAGRHHLVELLPVLRQGEARHGRHHPAVAQSSLKHSTLIGQIRQDTEL